MPRLTFEGDSLGAIVGEMRAFLQMVDRQVPEGVTPSAMPACPVHLVEMEFRPAGTNPNTQRRYSASYRCPRPGCRTWQRAA